MTIHRTSKLNIHKRGHHHHNSSNDTLPLHPPRATPVRLRRCLHSRRGRPDNGCTGDVCRLGRGRLRSGYTKDERIHGDAVRGKLTRHDPLGDIDGTARRDVPSLYGDGLCVGDGNDEGCWCGSPVDDDSEQARFFDGEPGAGKESRGAVALRGDVGSRELSRGKDVGGGDGG
ncbi:hypothetical protein BC936DRAFT_149346 [Jimgerdemannia flammicorona]|uniref:Uncharacterized protein n=1 Tax=Jimgerdemannia flammicorona TaxID=994334 RepID=A0A433D104_9FUNG|nr:hypothetical protein BC936DRAFT_149346 [Jimgerdemannia flammicorona]